ncbi:heat shock protein HspQ [Halioxenophilus sp. WMMB6]|uniref:heat shock protein HspQ n=1 Tax=Halioxenophilus sp. WMMB6 TaxID=3073815 RepID=UPI00295E568E|nr:heat shock protein HspQ [Halioxenophilus sp. WMMB6]
MEIDQSVEKHFAVGELVMHRYEGYRAVIYDVDPDFCMSDKWYSQHANGHPPAKEQSWYHVLVHGTGEAAYVPEEFLCRDSSTAPISHPLVGRYFNAFDCGVYRPSRLPSY